MFMVGAKTNSDIVARGLRFGSEDLSSYHRALAAAGIRDYELMPDMAESHGRLLQSAGEDQLSVSLSVLESTYDLVLNRADDLVAAQYRELTMDEDAGEFLDETAAQSGCVYSASLRGDPHSFGSVSLCEGTIQAILFHRTDSRKEFVVAPLTDNMHVAYRQLSERRSLRPCPDKHGERGQRSLEDQAPQWQPVGKQNKTIEIILVNDAARSKDARERRKSRASALAIMSAVNAFYAQLYGPEMYGVRFKIVSQISLRQDPWKLSTTDGYVDSQDVLDAFYEWKKSSKVPKSHLIHLLSGREFKDGYVGRSAQAGITDGGVCTDRNVGVSQVAGFDLGLYAKIVAHELGHSLAALHDDEFKDSACRTNSNTFMWSGISLEQGTKFTPCSANTIKDYFEGRSTFRYLGCLDS